MGLPKKYRLRIRRGEVIRRPVAMTDPNSITDESHRAVPARARPRASGYNARSAEASATASSRGSPLYLVNDAIPAKVPAAALERRPSSVAITRTARYE